MKITKRQLRRIIKESLNEALPPHLQKHFRDDGSSVRDPEWKDVTPAGYGPDIPIPKTVKVGSRDAEVETGKVEDVKKEVAMIRGGGYKPDSHEVWVAEKPHTPAQEQADELLGRMTGGFPGGPVQWHWDPGENQLFVHVKYNTF